MKSQRNTFAVEYFVTRTGRPWVVKVFASGEEVAEIQKGEGPTFVMKTKDGETLILSRTVNGEIKPFSLEMKVIKTGEAHGGEDGITAFTITDHLFEHHGKIYMLTNSPEGRPLREFLLGKRYICRLDNFPFSTLAEMDHETRSRLRKFRGVPAGEMDGFGTEGHHVRLSEELGDIGMPLAAACYLLYSTA